MTITTTNCNYHLSRLYKERDNLSISIDRAICSNKPNLALELEEEYNQKCDMIDQFIEFRKSHDCLLEGDLGYGPV